MLFDFFKRPELPITLHITHAKAGSTWVDAILARVLEDAGMAATARIQRSWYGSGEIVLHYENLLSDDVALFTKLFVGQLGLPVSAERAVVENRFEKKYKRKLGEEDSASHGRKGTPGDWRNHFTPRLAERFQELYGDVLPAGGYEADAGWVREVVAR